MANNKKYPLAALTEGKRVVVDEFLVLQQSVIYGFQVKLNIVRLTIYSLAKVKIIKCDFGNKNHNRGIWYMRKKSYLCSGFDL